ncbi:malonate decarboxylase holo-[acyl-carrier-protein] synthase [Variovorax ureilyticus]|uniref:malonate decarboxylase holo-[acyl-carrier-protein] synthase n=1 Tax=Variovorax ureilyticus TaxID=1836198 RepID=UPI003D6680B9
MACRWSSRASRKPSRTKVGSRSACRRHCNGIGDASRSTCPAARWPGSMNSRAQKKPRACCRAFRALHWRTLGRKLAACDASVRVYGAYGWQLLTGLPCVRESSDIDVWIGVRDAEQADAVAHHLEAFAPRHPRLDGELVFEDGTAVAWREWHAWRAGRARHLLVKRLHGASMADASFLRAEPLEMAA